MNSLFKLLDLVQKHADKEGGQHCLDLLESVLSTIHKENKRFAYD